ncbi:MAG: tRNA (N(6)-L-threonylcarbamoyladenosine(37)-C(2))-methylthiotransferase MtaB [Bacilli bacterium]|nr:tRNA (N(6)-L-threonylcarbamoyladenosine(37)-C(2))-methylthiotransferase MtaB [Bacilli bacterium]
MTYQIYTLGCKVNEYESEVMANLLENAGYTKSDNPTICIINTCTVTNSADSKSRKLIRSIKRNNPNSVIIATGCFIQNKKDLENLDIDIALGNKDKSKIVEYIKNYKQEKIKKIYNINDMEFEDMVLNNANRTRAYIKIEDGCDNYCTYCIIPYVRGHVRSKKKEKIIDEAKTLIKNGHKEIVLTGIHTGHYNLANYDLSDLLRDLCKLKGLERIRLSSIEITELNEKFLETLKENPKLVNHMHIPLQSGTNKILKLMNRKYDIEYFKNKIKKIRQIRPNINITTDVIVGFPGETEDDFKETINNIKEINFTKIHVFPYSKREGTKAANMKNQIDGNIKKQRVKKLLEISKELELDYMQKHLNKTIDFIPEVYKDGYLIGHSENYLLIKAKGTKNNLKNNISVKLTKITYPYIEGKINY